MNMFEGGQVDEFDLVTRPLGSLRELIIGHDNTGVGPGAQMSIGGHTIVG